MAADEPSRAFGEPGAFDRPRSAQGPLWMTLARVIASRWRPLVVLMAATFMIVLDFFIVNVAAPSMQRELHASSSGIEWVVAGYALSFAVCLVSAGRLGDAVGRRRALSLGFAIFTFASAACSASPDAASLVAARVVQGAAAALLSANVLSIIGVVYSGRERVRAISIYAMVMGLAAISGQIIGGGLIAADLFALGWRWIFLINLPVGLIALALAPSFVPESRTEKPTGFDRIGVALLTLGLTTLLLPLIEGRQYGWPLWGWLSLGVSPLLLLGFVHHERALAAQGFSPLLDMGLFSERSFCAGLLTQIALWSGQASFFLVLAFYLQEGRGLSPLRSGLVFAFPASAYLVASLRAPALTLRHGRCLVAAGALTLAAGHLTLLLGVHGIDQMHGLALLVPGLLLIGAGMGLTITPLTTTILASATPARAGSVSGALSTMQQTGNSLGVALTGVVFFTTLRHGVAHAFELSLAELALVVFSVAWLSRLLPRPVS